MNPEAAHRILSFLHPTCGAEYPHNQSTLDLHCALKHPTTQGIRLMAARFGRQLLRLQGQLASVKLLIIDEWPPRQAAPCPSDTGNDAGAVAAVETAQRQHRHVRLLTQVG